jgi:hypothetical protein
MSLWVHEVEQSPWAEDLDKMKNSEALLNHHQSLGSAKHLQLLCRYKDAVG